MRKGLAMVAGALALAPAATAGQGPAATTTQQDYDAATALDVGTDAAAALAAWDTLARRAGLSPRTRAIVQVRRGAQLFRLDRADEAVAATRAGLARLPVDDPTLATDRWRGWINLAAAARDAIDYASAAQAYAEAERAAPAASPRLGALLGLVDVATFVDPAAAEAALGRVDALAAAERLDDVAQAQVARRHALLLLNRGAYEQARLWSVRAVDRLGGLTQKTDMRDVAARSDAAIASLLAGRPTAARQYMAMTGAGRMPKGDLDPAVQMTVPDCGGEAGLKPQDMAVVEFSIDDTGAVSRVSPIYAAGGGAVALEFARRVHDWSWTPEQAKQFPLFFRSGVRIELRCSTAFERPSIARMLRGDLAAWLETKGLSLPDRGESADAVAIAGQRAALAAAEAKGPADAPALIPALYVVAENRMVGREETNALTRRALAIAEANGAPAAARLPIALQVRGTDRADAWRDDVYRRALAPLLDDPIYANDPRARSSLRLLLADSAGQGGESRTLLQQVAADPQLATADPLKVGALIRLASLAQSRGDTAAARAAFDRSGLSANQCAILDAPPRQLAVGGTFPYEAMTWGFEGWTRVQFDVAADGSVVGQRAVLSYPPFVFTKAGTQTLGTARYAKTFRPDGGLGCGGLSSNVRFRLPD